MFAILKKTTAPLGVSLGGVLLGLLCFDSSHAYTRDSSAVRGTTDYLEMLAENVQSLESRMYSLREADGGDEREIRNYYERVKEAYLMNKIRMSTAEISKALETYKEEVKASIDLAKNFPRPSMSPHTTSHCLTNSGFKKLDNDIEEVQDAMSASLNSPTVPSYSSSRFSSRYIDVTTGARLSDAADSLSKVLRTDPIEIVDSCVENLDANQARVHEQIKSRLESAKDSLEQKLARLSQNGRYAMVPDPLSTQLSAYQVGQILRSGVLNSYFHRLRSSPHGAMMEQEIWDQIVPTCQREKLVVEEKERPWQMAKAIGKTAFNEGICTLLPSIGAAKWTMSKAQGTIQMAKALHASGLVKCDLGTLDALAAQRTPQADLARLNFDVLKNKPYIDRIFTMMPYQNPLGQGVLVPNGGGLITNMGWLGGPTPAGPNLPSGPQLSPFKAIAGATGKTPLLRDPASTSVVSSNSMGGQKLSRLAPSRNRAATLGATVGNELAMNIQSAGRSIRTRGVGSLEASKSLRMGATETRDYLSSVNSSQDTQGANGLRRSRSKMSMAFREASQRLAMAAAASETSTTIRNAIGATASRGNSGTSVFGSTSSGSSAGQLNQVREANRSQKQVNVVVAQAIMKSVEVAVAKSSDYIAKMRTLAVQYKEEILKAEAKVYDAKPKDQVRISYELNRRLEKIVSDIAPLYALYNKLGSTINEGVMAMNRLYGSAGMGSPMLAGITQTPGFGTVPQGFPSAFSPNSNSGTGSNSGGSVFSSSSSSGSAFLKRINIGSAIAALLGIPEAIAEAKLEEEKNWAYEWDLFVREYENYANLRAKNLEEESQKSVELWQKSFEDKSLKAAEVSIDQIEANEIYVKALLEEGTALQKEFKQADQNKKTEYEISQDIDQTLQSAHEIKEHLDRANRNFLKNYPVNPDDHLTTWKRTLTTIVLETSSSQNE